MGRSLFGDPALIAASIICPFRKKETVFQSQKPPSYGHKWGIGEQGPKKTSILAGTSSILMYFSGVSEHR